MELSTLKQYFNVLKAWRQANKSNGLVALKQCFKAVKGYTQKLILLIINTLHISHISKKVVDD